jgi:hypothetical protein
MLPYDDFAAHPKRQRDLQASYAFSSVDTRLLTADVWPFSGLVVSSHVVRI